MCGVDDISDCSPRIHKVLLDIILLLYLMEGFFLVNESISCTGRKEKDNKESFSLKSLYLVETKWKTFGFCWSSRFMFGILYMLVSLFL